MRVWRVHIVNGWTPVAQPTQLDRFDLLILIHNHCWFIHDHHQCQCWIIFLWVNSSRNSFVILFLYVFSGVSSEARWFSYFSYCSESFRTSCVWNSLFPFLSTDCNCLYIPNPMKSIQWKCRNTTNKNNARTHICAHNAYPLNTHTHANTSTYQ